VFVNNSPILKRVFNPKSKKFSRLINRRRVREVTPIIEGIESNSQLGVHVGVPLSKINGRGLSRSFKAGLRFAGAAAQKECTKHKFKNNTKQCKTRHNFLLAGI